MAGRADKLAVADGHVVLNGRRQAEPSIASCGERPDGDLPRQITIPPGDWFMMGDNRGASDDSRFWGPVPADAFVGRPVFRYWPGGRLDGF